MKKQSSNNPVWQLLRHNVSIVQLIGYGLANIFGLAILLTAIQFYRDIEGAWSGEDTMISRDYIIISKTVKGGLSAVFGGGNSSTTFSKEEISALEAQPWSEKVGRFTAAECNVSASVEMGGRGLSTYLFLESIPDDYFDVRPHGWHFRPDKDTTVPIILSKDYLALYNFGFATSRGLPQISEGMVSMVPLQLRLSGKGKTGEFRGKIVGFSSRLNTIAVPQEFMDWANSEFSDKDISDPSRLIIETSTPGDPAIERYLQEHNYESAGDKVSNGRAAYFLRVLISVVGGVGIIITLLSFFILLLSIWLLLQKNRRVVNQLMSLGYFPSEVSRYYDCIIVCVNSVVVCGAVGLTLWASGLWSTPLSSIGVNSTSIWPTILTGIGLMIVVTLLNISSIHRKMLSFWHR